MLNMGCVVDLLARAALEKVGTTSGLLREVIRHEKLDSVEVAVVRMVTDNMSPAELGMIAAACKETSVSYSRAGTGLELLQLIATWTVVQRMYELSPKLLFKVRS